MAVMACNMHRHTILPCNTPYWHVACQYGINMPYQHLTCHIGMQHASMASTTIPASNMLYWHAYATVAAMLD